MTPTREWVPTVSVTLLNATGILVSENPVEFDAASALAKAPKGCTLDELIAAAVRFQAFLKVVETERDAYWIKSHGGGVFVNEALFHAAARAPLAGEDASFDMEELRTIALYDAEAEGSG
jgi:hypothetical protein